MLVRGFKCHLISQKELHMDASIEILKNQGRLDYRIYTFPFKGSDCVDMVVELRVQYCRAILLT